MGIYTVELARLLCRRCGRQDGEMDSPFCPKIAPAYIIIIIRWWWWCVCVRFDAILVMAAGLDYVGRVMAEDSSAEAKIQPYPHEILPRVSLPPIASEYLTTRTIP